MGRSEQGTERESRSAVQSIIAAPIIRLSSETESCLPGSRLIDWNNDYRFIYILLTTSSLSKNFFSKLYIFNFRTRKTHRNNLGHNPSSNTAFIWLSVMLSGVLAKRNQTISAANTLHLQSDVFFFCAQTHEHKCQRMVDGDADIDGQLCGRMALPLWLAPQSMPHSFSRATWQPFCSALTHISRAQCVCECVGVSELLYVYGYVTHTNCYLAFYICQLMFYFT